MLHDDPAVRGGSRGEALNVREVAEVLAMSEQRVRKALKTGEIPHHRYGRPHAPILRVMRSDLDDYIEACRVEPAPAVTPAGAPPRRRRRPPSIWPAQQ